MNDWQRVDYHEIIRTFAHEDEAHEELNILRLQIVKAGLVDQIVVRRMGRRISVKVVMMTLKEEEL